MNRKPGSIRARDAAGCSAGAIAGSAAIAIPAPPGQHPGGGSPHSTLAASAALRAPQIFGGYQGVGGDFEADPRPVLACVGSPLPLSDGMPRMRAAPAAI